MAESSSSSTTGADNGSDEDSGLISAIENGLMVLSTSGPSGVDGAENGREIFNAGNLASPMAITNATFHGTAAVDGPAPQDRLDVPAAHQAPGGDHPTASAVIAAEPEPAPAGDQAPGGAGDDLAAAIVLAADPEPAQAGDQAPANEPDAPVALQAAVPQAAGIPFYQKRKRDARHRVDRHLPGPGPVSDITRFIRIAEKINMLQGGNQDLQGLDGPSRIRQLLPEVARLRGTDTLLNAAADFCEQHEQQPPAA